MSAASTSFPLPRFTENTWTATNSKASPAFLRLPVSLSRLISLLDENGEDDYGQIGPSQFAFKTAFRLVANAISILDEDLPAAAVVDSEGGIRITWNRYDRQIKLVCPATKDAPVYVYRSSPGDNSLRNQNVTAAVLADRLSWLITRESAAAD
jgi:hypothetical protein